LPWSRIEHEVEVALRSPANLKVLRVLLQNRSKYLTKYYISKETGVPNSTRIMKALVELGWVEKQTISGHTRYRINMKNPKVKALLDFFTRIGYLKY